MVPSVIVPAHLLSCLRTETLFQGVLLGSVHDGSRHLVKSMLPIGDPSEVQALQAAYRDPQLQVIGWYVSVERPAKPKLIQSLFRSFQLDVGLARSATGYLAAFHSTQSCTVEVASFADDFSSFLHACYALEPAIDDQAGFVQAVELPAASYPEASALEAYERECRDYEFMLATYRMLMLPDEVLFKRLHAAELSEERRRRLGATLKGNAGCMLISTDSALSREELMQALASVK